MRIFAMSDIHGCLDAFLDALSLVDLEDKNNKLVLCGDYIHGGSHYYIDSDVLKNGVVPVLMYDTDAKKFYEVTERGNKLIVFN